MVLMRAAAGQALDMGRFNFDRLTDIDSVIVQAVSTALVIDVDGLRYAFSGSGVRYNSFGEPVSGTITGITITSGGATLFQLGGLAISAPAFYLSTYAPNSPLPQIFAGNDQVYGGELQDQLLAGEGHNIVMGGAGGDRLVAGSGNDHLYGASPDGGPDGDDVINAGGGSDYVQGNAGIDMLYGEDGSDRINGGAGDDRVFGGNGHDVVNGNRDNDTIFGEAGNDILRGGQGKDSLIGGDGDDVLMGDLGTDKLEGNAGNDIFVFTPGSTPIGGLFEGFDRIMDFGVGDDRLSIGFVPQAVLIYQGDPISQANDAQIAALRMMNEHPGDGEVAIVKANGGAVMYWNSAGGSTIDSALSFMNSRADSFTLDDFI
ncbi:MAG: calcium-binding protein [Pseudomonadota bacterium]